MRADVLIVGQGLAGTLLAWECERAGLAFAIADADDGTATTLAGAGLITPITGRRFVPSWRIDGLLPLARGVYRDLATALEVPLWTDLRVRRWFADDGERETWQARARGGQGVEARYVESVDHDGIWIKDAARVDLGALIAAAGKRWKRTDQFHRGPVDLGRAVGQYAVVIDCTGLAGASSPSFNAIPWEFSKGELLELAAERLAPRVVLNRRHWVMPVGPGQAWVGATHQPGVRDRCLDPASRALLEASARALLGPDCALAVTGHRAGVRVTLPDKRPVAGRHPAMPRLGLVNGLGGKGALWAPMLAQQWAAHLRGGAAFDPEIDVRRFWEAPRVPGAPKPAT